MLSIEHITKKYGSLPCRAAVFACVKLDQWLDCKSLRLCRDLVQFGSQVCVADAAAVYWRVGGDDQSEDAASC